MRSSERQPFGILLPGTDRREIVSGDERAVF
jgi:hypothetical protein